MVSKIANILEAIRYDGGLRALAGARPRSLTSWLIANRLKALGLDFGTIVDAGANAGQFARAAHECFPDATILSFEPLTDVAERLQANLADVQRHRVYQTAIGAFDGVTKFHRNSYSQSSSVAPMLDQQGGLLEGTREIEQLTVPMARLDTLLRSETLTPPVLLKLDLQGHELEALKGADETLSRCSHVMLETVFQQQYADEPVFEELWKFLSERQFSFDRPLNFSAGRAGGIVQMDALFRRRLPPAPNGTGN